MQSIDINYIIKNPNKVLDNEKSQVLHFLFPFLLRLVTNVFVILNFAMQCRLAERQGEIVKFLCHKSYRYIYLLSIT